MSASQLIAWLAGFCDMHERAHRGELSDAERKAYLDARDELAGALVAAQRLNIRPGESPRKALRVARTLPVDFETETGKVSSLTIDLSAGGLSALVAQVPATGTSLGFRLRIKDSQPIAGRCKVVASAPQKGLLRMSVMFEALAPEVAERIELLIFDAVVEQIRPKG